MKTWNMTFIVISLIGTILSVYSLINIFITDYVSLYEENKAIYSKSGITLEDLQPKTFDIIVSVVLLVIFIYTIIMALKNKGKLERGEGIDVIPYILRLMATAYSIIMVMRTFFMGGTDNSSISGLGEEMKIILVVTRAILIIGYILNTLPSVRILMLNGKYKKLEEVEKNNGEEE